MEATPVTPRDINPDSACAFLEHGGVIFFPESPFKFSKEHTQFLLSQTEGSRLPQEHFISS